MHHSDRLGPISWLIGLLVANLPAQLGWTAADGRAYHGMTFDATRNTMVLYGGQGGSGSLLSDTWELASGGEWTQIPTTNNPGGLSGLSMAFNGVTVQFGGMRSSGPIDETWEWTGSQWLFSLPPARPAPRSNHAMAYDSDRNRVVLFGGLGTTGPLADTWEWDGTAWQQLTLPQSPPARESHAMAYDPGRRRVILTGGNAGNLAFRDAWFLDVGAQRWRQEPTPAWSARTRHAMAFDAAVTPARNRLVLFGGSVQGQATDETWTWSGSQWQLVASSGPLPRWGHALAYDGSRQRVVLTGGTDEGFSQISSTWEWDGNSWSQRFGNLGPTGRAGHSLTFDSARGVSTLIGGQNASINRTTQVFDWNGTQWLRQRPATSPGILQDHAAAFDASRAVHVLFGHPANPPALNETWEWNGTQWTMVRVGLDAMRPSTQLEGTALAYDSLRQQVILFGGFESQSGYQSETREWRIDGTCACRVWQRRLPAASPPGRAFHAMAYDQRRDRIVLFGGKRGSAGMNDTWEWDGTNWSQAMPATSPPPRFGHVLAFDAARARIVLFGGIAETVVWEWDGSNWSPRSPARPVVGRSRSAMTFDAARGNLLVFGGENAGTYFGDTLTLAPTQPAAFALGGAGCLGSAGVPLLDADLAVTPWNLPWLGGTFVTTLRQVPAGSVAFGILGLSDALWEGLPLPLDFVFFGMPGCPLRTSTELTVAVPTGTGTATLPWPLPNDANLLGLRFHNQALVLDRPANAFGATFSNLGSSVIGGR